MQRSAASRRANSRVTNLGDGAADEDSRMCWRWQLLLQHGGGAQAILYDTDDVQVAWMAGDIKGRASVLELVEELNEIIIT